ncbi:hypothetical protein F4553_006860 [Allocatelliglobosispora scoriae]|uniref:Uncharacterized protein n=1 Tax=Allocatelliglobosispora scoriae TaxID=643052 RepID=A0A841C0P6_9ACTN|nr:hypothetical protein [Allocatelliglobosispora scoriae]MBB5873426.1 hypothetical protein [Allocatelliglobosispora scoriae]
MTDPYARPSGQPDPSGPPQPSSGDLGQPGPAQPGYPQPQPSSAPPAYPSSGPPAYPPGGQPAYAPGQAAYTPDGQPAYGQGGQQPPKSRKGLIIGLVVGAVVLLLLVCGGAVALILNAADDDTTPTASSTRSVAPTGAASPQNNNGVTANSSSDFGDVCQGGTILNAAEVGSLATAKAYVFSNTPARMTSWSSKILDSDASYYAKSADYSTVSVVGCLAYQEGSEGAGQKCDIKASDGTKLTVDYLSSRYTLTFYAAKTGEKIGDGGTINAPANKCPMLISYNRETLKSYASPDNAAIDAAVKKFVTA